MNQTIKEWYQATYPEDTDMFPALHPTATFQDLFYRLDTHKDVYPLCADDSIVRERTFTRLAELMEVEYGYVYTQWLQ